MEEYPEGVEPIRGNHPGLIPVSEKLTKKNEMYWKATEMAMRPCYPLQTHSHEM